MATIKELRDEVESLVLELGVDAIPTDSFSHKELTQLVMDLKAKLKDASLDTAADLASVRVQGGYYVAPGKSVTSGGKMFEENTALTSDMLAGGSGAMKKLIEIGVVVKK